MSRVTLRVYERRELRNGVQLPQGLKVVTAHYYKDPDGVEYFELVCVDEVPTTTMGEFRK